VKGNIFISVKDADKPAIADIARDFLKLGFEVYSTEGTANAMAEAGVQVKRLRKIGEGRPNVLDMIKNGEIHFIVNTPSGRTPRINEIAIRSLASANRIAITTTLRAARASVDAIRALKSQKAGVRPIQDYHPKYGKK